MIRDKSDSQLGQVEGEIESLIYLVDILVQKASVLPRVDEDGYSECHFAEDLYAEKEEAALAVRVQYKKLKRLQGIVKEILNKNNKNLQIINRNHGYIQNSEAKNKYTDAELSQQQICKKALEKLEKINETLSWADKITKLTNAKKYPGKEPEKKFRPPAVPVEGMPSNVSGGITGYTHERLDQQISSNPVNGLLALGPLNRNMF